MKKIFQLVFTFFFLTFSKMGAVTSSNSFSNQNQKLMSEKTMLMTPLEYEYSTGKKLSFVEKLGFKILQKKLKKGAALPKAGGDGGNLLSLLSCIFGGAGLLIAFVSGLGGILLGIAGLVLGIIALKKEDSRTLAIIGTICGGLVVLISIVAVIIVASAL